MAMEFERRQEGREVTLVYRPWACGDEVELRCERPLPERMRQEQAAQAAGGLEAELRQRLLEPPRRRRRRLWIGLGILTALVCLGVGLWWYGTYLAPRGGGYGGGPEGGYWDGYPYFDEDYYWDTEETPAETTIARYPTGGDVRLTLTAEHPDEPLTAGEIYEKVNPAVVTVLGEQRANYSVGTGVIFSEDGYIITNYHVVSGCSACTVLVTDSYGADTRYPAKLVGYDEDNDLAVLKIEALGLLVAEFGVSDDLAVGDRVYAIGNPLGLELRNTLTDGLVSAIDRDVDVEGVTMTLIQTNAALNSGNSGGPLINAYGQVVGINTIKMVAAYDDEASVEGLGFAIPSSTVAHIVNSLIATGEVQPQPVLGITVQGMVTLPDGNAGVQIIEVTPGLGGDLAGVRAGDVIVSADGEQVYTNSDVLRARRRYETGEHLPMVIYRDGEYLEVEVLLMPPLEP